MRASNNPASEANETRNRSRLDLIGLDVCLDIMTVLFTQLGHDKYFPCPKLRQLVTAGRLGNKTGRGVYEY